MNLARSLRLRVILATISILVLAVILILILIGRMFESTATRQFDARLNSYLEQVAAVVSSERKSLDLDRRLSTGGFGRPFSGLYWQLQSDAGRTMRSRSLWDEKIVLPTDVVAFNEVHRHETLGPNNQPIRALERRVVAADNSRWLIAVASDRTTLDNEITNFRWALVQFAGVVLVLALALAFVQFFIMQRPLASLSKAISRLESGEQTRLVGRFPSELDQLVRSLNQLIGHNEEITRNARMQATNLAHTIKTPVTILQNEIARVKQDAEDTDWQSIDQSVGQIDAMSQFYLARAQGMHSKNRPKRTVHVRPIVFDLMQAIEQLHRERKLDLSYQCAPGAVFMGDAVDLKELLGNLLDNAAKWAKSRVTLQCHSDESGLTVVIEDDGPGIPSAERSQILEPGKRLDDSVPGSGFGLAIATDLVRAYRGSLELDDAYPSGLRIAIHLPQ